MQTRTTCASAPHASGSTNTPRRIDSRELFRDSNQVEILHQGATYRLQITRLGKLILTK